jgi:energy-coupling factor transport system substrate-specific component
VTALASGQIRFHWRSSALLAATSVAGIAAFTWPLFTRPRGSENLAHAGDAPWMFIALVPLLVGILLSELADGALDAKAVAMLGVLVACGAALRAPTTGVTGFTGVFFLLIPGGRVFGRGFGFVQGALTMFASALLTGGVGPWLPFQMLCAAWVGFFAGCLPRARGRSELALLATYGAVAGLVYGLVMDMWFWPFGTSGTQLHFVAGAAITENLRRFWAFHLASALGFDLPRAAGNALLVLLVGTPVLAALRRAARRAAFGAPIRFESSGPRADVVSGERGRR